MDVVIALILLVVPVYLLAVLTEDFFAPSIDIISTKLKLSSDAAGATLLVMGCRAGTIVG